MRPSATPLPRLVALGLALTAAGCNAIAGIGEPTLDPCVDGAGGGCATGGSGPGNGGNGGSVASSVTTTTATAAMSSSSTGPAVPVCGNGVLEPGEQCDDGNLVDGDGCSHQCEVECSGMGHYLDPTTFHCYEFFPMQLQWGEARDACVAAHAHLATFTSPAELDAVAPHAMGQWWIDGERGGQGFVWEDGEPWTFERWKGGAPSTDPSKACVKLDGGQFNAEACMTKLGILCERDPAGT